MNNRNQKLIKKYGNRIQLITGGAVVITVHNPSTKTVACNCSNVAANDLVQIIRALISQLSDEWQIILTNKLLADLGLPPAGQIEIPISKN